MNSELDLLDNILARGDVQTLNKFLEFCEETRLFNKHPEASNEIIPAINRLLNETPKRLAGALLLKTFLPQCPRLLAGPHVFSWIQMSIRGILAANDNALVDVSLNLLTDLIPLSVQFPDVKKDVSQNLSGRIVDCLKNLGVTEHKLLALRCLHEFLQNYGKSCGTFKENLSKFLLSLIDCSPDIVHVAALCYQSLAAVGSPGSDMENYINSWESQQTFLINGLNFVLNGLFEGVIEIQGPSNPATIKEIDSTLPPILSKLPLLRAIKRAAQFRGLGQFLCIMIGGKFIAIKRLSIESLLSVICRTLAVNCDTVKSNLSLDSLHVSMQIPVIHETAINILRSLIASCRMNLVTHGALIRKLLGQTLKCTQVDEWPHRQMKPFSIVRTSAYNCLQFWLSMSRSSSNVKDSLPNIVNAILYDIRADKPAVQINVQTKQMKGKEGKKQRQAMMMSSLTEETEHHCGSRLVESELFVAALKSLSTLFLSCASQLDLKDVKNLRVEIVQHLLTLQSSIPWETPYDNENCRLQLYNTFFAMCSVRRPDFAPPLNLAHSLFSDGLQDPSPNVAICCNNADSYISRLIQPYAPTLRFESVLQSPSLVSFSTKPSSLLLPTLTPASNTSKPPKKLKIRLRADKEQPPVDDTEDYPTPSSSSTASLSPNHGNNPEVNLVSDSSSSRFSESIEIDSNDDDDIVEIDPETQTSPVDKNTTENDFEPEEKRVKPSTNNSQPIIPEVRASDSKKITTDMLGFDDELETDMLNSFNNVIDE